MRSKSVWFAAVGILLSVISTAFHNVNVVAQTAAAVCPGAPAARLIVGAVALVAPGSANNIREAAATSAKVVIQAQPGDNLLVIGGPTCAEGYLWWNVALTSGEIGWTVEGSSKGYFLNPTSTHYQTFNAASGSTSIDVAYQPISFTYNNFAGNSVLAETVNAVKAAPNTPDSDDPQHLLFAFGTWNDETQFYKRPQILIYNVKDIRAVAATNPTGYAQAIDDLTQLLSKKPDLASVKEIPVFPGQNAGQVFHAQSQYVKFKGGTSIRFVTQYAQDAGPISNDRLTYMFVGLTDDGASYVFARIPVTDSALEGNDKAIPQDYTASDYGAQYTAYVKASVQKIDQSKATDFTPSLTDLDALFASLKTQ